MIELAYLLSAFTGAAKNKTMVGLTQYSSNNSWNLNWSSGLNNNNKNNNNYVRAFTATRHYTNKGKDTGMNDTFTLEEVLEAYYECRRNKRRTANQLMFEADYESKCVDLWRDLNGGVYEIGRSITFVVTRPKFREVFAADFRDRIVHHIIIRRIGHLFESVFIDDNYNCRKGKGTLYGVKRFKEMVRQCTDEYSRDCWIGKFDMQGFFMTIHKPTLWRMLDAFLYGRLTVGEYNLLAPLVKQVVMHCPEKNCVRKSPMEMWDKVPDGKSLFSVGDDYGLPIGNLTSQIFANFYLHEFDVWMKGRFVGYGRYVDDFFVLAHDKQDILDAIPEMRNYLASNVGVRLHPDKVYIQHYTKGCKFTGSVVKRERTYIGNSTVSNMMNTVCDLNKLVADGRIPSVAEIAHFVCCMNSYFGFLKHHKAYAIKRRICNHIADGWWQYIYISGRFKKVSVKREYRELYVIRKEAMDMRKRV